MAYSDPMLTHLDRMLTNISVGYRNGEFVADVLFPTVRVRQPRDSWWVFERRAFSVHDDLRAPGGKAKEIPPRKITKDSYFAQEHALVDIVPREEPEIAGREGLDPLTDSTEELTDAILLRKEKQAADIATTVANYATGHAVTLSGAGDKWDNYGSSDSTPISDAKTARDRVFKSIGRKPNVAVASYPVRAALEDHPAFIERIKYGGTSMTTDQIVGQLLDVGRMVTAGAMISDKAPGQDIGFDDTDYLWGKDFVMAHVPSRPGRKVPAYGYEFAWPFRRGVRGAGGRDMPTERWYDQDHDGDKIRVRRRYDLKPVAVDTVANLKIIGGYLIKDAV